MWQAYNISRILFCLPTSLFRYCLLICFYFTCLSLPLPWRLLCEGCWGLGNAFYCLGYHLVSRKYLIMWRIKHCTISSWVFPFLNFNILFHFLKAMKTQQKILFRHSIQDAIQTLQSQSFLYKLFTLFLLNLFLFSLLIVLMLSL